MLLANPLINVRPATPNDAAALTAIFRDCWRLAYTAIIPAAELAAMTHKRNEMWWRAAIARDTSMLVLEAAGTVAGYATLGRARASRVYQGEIYELYLSPVYQGIGLGAHLFEACRQRLDAKSLNGLIVWALADNSAAVEFYLRRGGRQVGQAAEKFGSKSLAKIAFGWT